MGDRGVRLLTEALLRAPPQPQRREREQPHAAGRRGSIADAGGANNEPLLAEEEEVRRVQQQHAEMFRWVAPPPPEGAVAAAAAPDVAPRQVPMPEHAEHADPSGTFRPRPRRQLPAPNGDVADGLLLGRVIAEVSEDLTHGWTVLRLCGGGVLALALVDPDVRVTRLPLQPPPLQPLSGQRVERLYFRRGGVPVIAAAPRHLVLFALAARKGRIRGLGGCARTLAAAAEWIPSRMTLVVAPIFDRLQPYPLAIAVVDPVPGPQRGIAAGEGVLYHPNRGTWTRPAVLSLPPPVVPGYGLVAEAQTGCAGAGGRRCSVM